LLDDELAMERGREWEWDELAFEQELDNELAMEWEVIGDGVMWWEWPRNHPARWQSKRT
jgi:hypothetical protein